MSEITPPKKPKAPKRDPQDTELEPPTRMLPLSTKPLVGGREPTKSSLKGHDNLPDEPQDVATLNLDGRGKHRRSLETFATLDPKEQHHTLRDAWKQVAMGVALRAKAFATTCSPKDFGRLYQLVMSGAVSLDKAFPPKESNNAPRLVVNLFGSLGQRAANIAIPKVPVIEAESVKEIPHVVSPESGS